MNTAERTAKLKQLRTIVETRTLTCDALAQHVLAMLRLGEAVFVVHEPTGGKALALARGVGATEQSFTLELTNLRPLAASDVEALLGVGAGVFKPPAPPPRITDDEHG